MGGLKQQEFILAQIWRPDVQKQGVGGTALPGKALGENANVWRPWRSSAVLGLWAQHPTLCPHLHVPPLLRVRVSVSSSHKDTVTGLRTLPSPVGPHFHLTHESVDTVLPNRAALWSSGRTWNLGKYFSTHSTTKSSQRGEARSRSSIKH